MIIPAVRVANAYRATKVAPTCWSMLSRKSPKPWTPYLDIDIAMAMLNLPQERRANRQWQRDFFTKVGLDLESQGLASTWQNNLNFQAIRRIPVRPLDRDLLADVIDPAYVDWINWHARMTPGDDLTRTLLGVRKVGGALRRLGVRAPPTLEAYCAYLCLRPIESLMMRSPGYAHANRPEVPHGDTHHP